MNKIISPLRIEMKGAAVADLQDGLRLLLNEGGFQLSDAERQNFLERLRIEHTESVYGERTRELIGVFQRQNAQNGLKSSGEVDGPTANALNTALEKLGAFKEAPPNQQWMVGGQVRREDGKPFQGAIARAFHLGERGVLRLGEDSTDAEGRYTIRYATLPGAATVNLRVTVFSADGKPLRESNVIRKANPLEIVDLIVPGVDSATFQVEGKVTSRVSAGVGGLRVRIMDKTVGNDVQLAEAVTDDDGAYQATFTDDNLRGRGKTHPDLQARVFAGEKFLAASETRYDASNHEILDIQLDEKAASALQSEYETLTAALSKHYKGKLGDLKETDDQQDMTMMRRGKGSSPTYIRSTGAICRHSGRQ